MQEDFAMITGSEAKHTHTQIGHTHTFSVFLFCFLYLSLYLFLMRLEFGSFQLCLYLLSDTFFSPMLRGSGWHVYSSQLSHCLGHIYQHIDGQVCLVSVVH